MAIRSVIPFRRPLRIFSNPQAMPRVAKRGPVTVRKTNTARRTERMYCLFDALELVNERMNNVIRDSDLGLTDRQFTELLHRTFPELYAQPPVPPKPTDTCIGTADRVAIYVARAAAGKSLFHPADVKADLIGHRSPLLGGFVNQTCFKVTGWADQKYNGPPEDPDAPCPDCGMDLPPSLEPGYCHCGI